jgi:transposase
MATWKECGVNIDYHIAFEHNYYSVPYQLVHQRVEARATSTTVEVFFKSRRVASHARQFGRGRAVTLTEHMPRSHRAHAEWTPSRIVAWAEKTGPAAARVVTEILNGRPHPEQAYRASLGLLRLGKTYGPERLEAACRRAEALHSFSYRTVKNILASGLDRVPFDDSGPSPLPAHDNIRGAAYYQGD